MHKNRFMWKTAYLFICSCVLACTVTGCGQTAEKSVSEQTESAARKSVVESSGASKQEREAQDFFAGITPSDYIYFDQDYRSIRIPEEEAYITEEDVQAQVDSFLLEHRNFEEIPERKAMFGDVVVLDFTGESNGETVCDEKDYSFELGSDITSYGFEDTLEGACAGDELILDLEYPEDYEDEMLAGQKIHFNIQVDKVYMVSIPDYTNSFIASHTEYSNIEEYEAAVRSQMEADFKADAAAYWIGEHAQMNGYPETLKVLYEKQLLQELELAAEEEYQMDSEQLLSQMGFVSEREFLDSNRSFVLDEVKSDLSYGYIAEQEGIEFQKAEYETYAKQFATENECSSPEELYKWVDPYTVRMNFLRDITMKKLIEYITLE